VKLKIALPKTISRIMTASVQSLTKTDMITAESRKSTIGLVNGLSNKLIRIFVVWFEEIRADILKSILNLL